ncbi:hypothetical protein [Thalassotalea sp. ND16A]|uniref:hypothetical protein n=1 Tax=Thalassotalea sp. ND16A TaxID=1535422 RepID=UPI00051A6CEA|nr:hypothetical protein [Thalassotalea sp. ND16A]KGJ95660.1 hypothetical protein ND16A_1195 [Thalassotalea sp. ND16A]
MPGLIDGHVVGPRIFPSGAFISQTSGHGDFGERLMKNKVKVVFASDYVGGEMLAMSGPRNPYAAAGKLDVVEVGAAADLLLIDGNPLEDMSVLGATTTWFDADPVYKEVATINIVMKNGVIYRNTL